jgi:hypothetical protein
VPVVVVVGVVVVAVGVVAIIAAVGVVMAVVGVLSVWSCCCCCCCLILVVERDVRFNGSDGMHGGNEALVFNLSRGPFCQT